MNDIKHQILEQDKLYAEGKPTTWTDEEYDRKLAEYRKQNPDFHPLGVRGQTQGNDVQHIRPMLSLDNTFDMVGVEAFINRIHKLKDCPKGIVCEPKYDGMAVSLRYEDGIFKKAVTRGDGQKGQDVTLGITTYCDIPLQMANLGKNVEIRGEVVLTRQMFARLNEIKAERNEHLYANMRNAVVGVIRQKEPKKEKGFEVNFVAYDILIDPKYLTDSHRTNMKILHDKEDFLVATSFADSEETIKEVQIKKIEDLYKRLDGVQDSAYECDGMVIKADSRETRRRLGEGNHYPHWALAYKFQNEEKTTIVKEITLQVGRMGAITPVAEVAPVELAGATIERVSLHNFDEIDRLQVNKGATVKIKRAGQVIPKITGTVEPAEDKYERPTQCPSCEGNLEDGYDEDQVVIRCKYDDCKDKVLAKLSHFVSQSCYDIDGFGYSTIKKLYEAGIVTRYSDILFLPT